jgi:hypothetical protein
MKITHADINARIASNKISFTIPTGVTATKAAELYLCAFASQPYKTHGLLLSAEIIFVKSFGHHVSSHQPSLLTKLVFVVT